MHQKKIYKNLKSDNDNIGLLKKISFILLILTIYRIGSYIPLPGVNLIHLDNIMHEYGQGILGVFNVLTGGSLGRMSIFTLNIMPYITASIIVQLVQMIFKDFRDLGNLKKNNLHFYSKLLAILLSATRGFNRAHNCREHSRRLGHSYNMGTL